MKNIVLKCMPVVLITAFCLTACDLAEEVGVVTFEEEFDMVFTVNESESTTDMAYADSRVLELKSNATLEPYVNRLQEITVNRITYKVTDFSTIPAGTQVFLNEGKISFGPVDNITRLFELPVSASANGIDLGASNAETDLNISQAQLSAVAQALLNKKEVKMYTEGKLSKTPVAFNVVARVYVTVKAKAL
jgi:hypothetical protein